jgi:ubiquinone/menaquinone biosynthesis C-methylase UbiE
MGLYERYACPLLVEFALRGGYVKKNRGLLLADVGGDVLEIGFGTGMNLEFYPDAIKKITVIDPSGGMHSRARKRVAESGIEVEPHELGAEQLPFDAGRFDSVVSTFTMCTIGDLIGAIREVRRVLKPGGKLFFLEHVAAEDPKVLRWQNRLNPIQKLVGCGCHINRDIESFIRQGDFEIPAIDRFAMPKTPAIHAQTIRGHAVKSA